MLKNVVLGIGGGNVESVSIFFGWGGVFFSCSKGWGERVFKKNETICLTWQINLYEKSVRNKAVMKFDTTYFFYIPPLIDCLFV